MSWHPLEAAPNAGEVLAYLAARSASEVAIEVEGDEPLRIVVFPKGQDERDRFLEHIASQRSIQHVEDAHLAIYEKANVFGMGGEGGGPVVATGSTVDGPVAPAPGNSGAGPVAPRTISKGFADALIEALANAPVHRLADIVAQLPAHNGDSTRRAVGVLEERGEMFTWREESGAARRLWVMSQDWAYPFFARIHAEGATEVAMLWHREVGGWPSQPEADALAGLLEAAGFVVSQAAVPPTAIAEGSVWFGTFIGKDLAEAVAG